MSDRRLVDLNPPERPSTTSSLDLIRVSDKGKIPTSTDKPVLPSLDVLTVTGSGSSVLGGGSRLSLDALKTAAEGRKTTADATSTGKPADTGTTGKTTDTTTRVVDTTTRADATDASAKVSDAAIPKPVRGVLELEYGDPNFDKAIQQKDYHTLKIKGLPEGVELKPWVDTGGYFFWFKNGNDSRAHHYFPANVQTVQIEVFTGKHYKPYVKPAEELRISAAQGALYEENKSGFSSYDNRTHPYRYAEKMSEVADKALDLQEKALREGAAASPRNPYFRIYLADILLARAVKPVIEGVKAGKDIKFDNDETMKRINEAIEELKKAEEITYKYGDVKKGPNLQLQRPLSPFGLNPYYYNPDFYWSGAAYQAFQRRVTLEAVKTLIRSGALKIELPPALPPK